MSEAKSTPGPWRISQPSNGFSAIYGPKGELIFGLAAGGQDEKQPDDVCDANARLIEAAPELAEALEKLLDCHLELLEGEFGSVGADPEECDIARAALKKAGRMK